MRKLARRSRKLHHQWQGIARPEIHPHFRRVRGTVESWET
jgi:hypothetical protein